jgi:hypothetical protein
MRHFIILLFLFSSFNLYSQKIMLAVQDEEIDILLANKLYKTEYVSLVKTWQDSEYIIRAVFKEIPQGIVGSLVISWPFYSYRVEKILEENGVLLYPYGTQMNEIKHQSCIVARDKKDMANYIYNEILKVIEKNKWTNTLEN